MAYKKPQIVAKSAVQRSFVAGCPPNATGCKGVCKRCERTA